MRGDEMLNNITAEKIGQMKKEYLTAGECAEALGISICTFYQYAEQMEFPVKRIGRAYRIPRKPFLEFLTTGKVSEGG